MDKHDFMRRLMADNLRAMTRVSPRIAIDFKIGKVVLVKSEEQDKISSIESIAEKN